jgi:hypothetical protein
MKANHAETITAFIPIGFKPPGHFIYQSSGEPLSISAKISFPSDTTSAYEVPTLWLPTISIADLFKQSQIETTLTMRILFLIARISNDSQNSTFRRNDRSNVL